MTAEAVPPETHPRITRTQVAAAVMGNALEFYDFTTYTIFAVDIGKAFFPSHSPFASLMASLGTFGRRVPDPADRCVRHRRDR